MHELRVSRSETISSLLSATLSFTDPPGFRNCVHQDLLGRNCPHIPLLCPASVVSSELNGRASGEKLTSISTPSASLSECIRSRGVFPIKPMTPSTTSSVRSWIGRLGTCTTALCLHQLWKSIAKDVDDKETVTPNTTPHSKSRVTRVGRRSRSHTDHDVNRSMRDDMAPVNEVSDSVLHGQCYGPETV